MSGKTQEIHEKVKKYYSDLINQKDGKPASSIFHCAPDEVPESIREIVSALPDEIAMRYCGCGSPIPDKIEGCTVLDLGCGAGRDAYVVSKLVGENGKVIGIDMNDDQLAIARRYQDEMAEKWGFSNVVFKKGYIEDLASAGIEDGSIDVVISNCAINLSPDKESVFSEIHRVLRGGGVLYFRDVFSSRQVSGGIHTHPLLLGECLGGAMTHDELLEIMTRNNWIAFAFVSSREISINNAEIEKLIGNIQYTSDTIRAVKKRTVSCGSCQVSKPDEKDDMALPYA